MFDVDNLLGYDTNAYQLIQHVVAACFYLNFSHTNVAYCILTIIMSSAIARTKFGNDVDVIL